MRITLLKSLILLSLSPVFLTAASEPAIVPSELRGFFQEHCVRCHGPDRQKANLRIDTISSTIADEAIAQQWQDLLDVLNLSEMPPPEEDKQPSKHELQDALETLTATLQDARDRLTDTGGAIVIRRLNNREYQNTIREIFGIDLDVEMLPQDGSLDGFDTLGQAHSLSSLHIERYLSVGRRALEEVYFPITGKSHRHGRIGRVEPEKKINEGMRKGLPKMKSKLAQLRKDVANGKKWREIGVLTKEEEIPIAEEYLTRPEIETGVLLPFRGAPGQISFPLAPWGSAPNGRYRMTIRFGLAEDKHHDDVFLAVVRGQPGSTSPDEVRYFHVTGTMDEPQEATFEFAADGVMSNHFYIRRRSYEDYKKEPFENTEGYHWSYDRVAYEYLDDGPQIWVDWVEAEGPLPNDAPLAPSQLFADKNFGEVSREEILEFVRTIAFHAFRHQAPQPGYLDRLMAIYDEALAFGLPKHQAFFDAVNPILASPGFLFLFEPRQGDEPRPLTGLELASRLSYFLWSAPPDDHLYELAATGELLQPSVLAAEVNRMIQSEKSAAFVDAFLGQWLELDRLSHVEPAKGAQPAYDDAVRRASREEVLASFHHLLRHDKPATALVDADFVVVNQIMANFYGIPAAPGDAFQPVSLPKDSLRGGLLGQSAILALTGTGERTSPVERGTYVLRKILNRPPPPAPANVPMLDESAVGVRSIRETLSLHMDSPQCSSCHRRIDPLGYAMENFDPVGLWRTEVASSDGSTTFPVETAGLMPDGKRHFSGFEELKAYLVDDRDAFVTGLTEALMTYGYGRSVGFSDQALVEEIVAECRAQGYGLRHLLTRIILSEPFLTK